MTESDKLTENARLNTRVRCTKNTYTIKWLQENFYAQYNRERKRSGKASYTKYDKVHGTRNYDMETSHVTKITL